MKNGRESNLANGTCGMCQINYLETSTNKTIFSCSSHIKQFNLGSLFGETSDLIKGLMKWVYFLLSVLSNEDEGQALYFLQNE